jgi:hypothetical protein
MVPRVLSVVTLSLALVLDVSAAGPLKERTLSIPGRGMLVLSSPRTWSQQISQPPEILAPTIRFSSTGGQKFEVSVTAFSSPTNDSTFNSPSKVRAIVEDTVDEIRPQLVEKDIPLFELRGGSGTGYYISGTDKAPGPNEYKYLTQGAMAVEDLLLTFTILTNKANSSVVKDALDMLRSARRGT